MALAFGTLPGIQVAWDQWSQSGWTFVQYSVKRRRAAYTDAWGNTVPAGTWVRIATITDVTITVHTDYLVGSASVYEYAVTVSANNGTDTLESDLPATPPSDSVTFDGVFLHDVGDADHYAELVGRALRAEPEQAVEYRRARGRRTPTAFVGESRGHVLHLDTLDFVHDDGNVWDALDALHDRQYSAGAVLCLRPGYARSELYFVLIDAKPIRQDQELAYSASIPLREVHYEEAV